MGAINEKIRPLNLLQILKFEEIKWSYFFYWRPTHQDVIDMSFHDILSQNNQISTPRQW